MVGVSLPAPGLKAPFFRILTHSLLRSPMPEGMGYQAVLFRGEEAVIEDAVIVELL